MGLGGLLLLGHRCLGSHRVGLVLVLAALQLSGPLHRLHGAALSVGLAPDLLGAHQLHVEQLCGHVVVHLAPHRPEDDVPFPLVLHLRVAAAVATQPDALPQMVHLGEVRLPMAVDLAEVELT